MRIQSLFAAALGGLPFLVSAQHPPAGRITAKVFILSTFVTEQEAWRGVQGIPDIFAQNITVEGLMGEVVHCDANAEVCQAVVGEGEINAALSTSALPGDAQFDLTSTYFLIAGLSSINPKLGTLGSVTFARYAVLFGMQHEVLSSSFSNPYIPLGANDSSSYPAFMLGTEVFEVNDSLRRAVAGYASRAHLNDTDEAMVYRSHYQNGENTNQAGTSPPGIVLCDSVTSDTWYSGASLGSAIEDYVRLVTNGTGEYCTAAQEDNAILAALLRHAVRQVVDFGRVIVMRAGADFDREAWNMASPLDNLLGKSKGAVPALVNIGIAGAKVVGGILGNWTEIFEQGVQVDNYVGDVWGSLGGDPDFGLGKKLDVDV